MFVCCMPMLYAQSTDALVRLVSWGVTSRMLCRLENTKPLPLSQFPAGARSQQRPGGRYPQGNHMRPGGSTHMPRPPSGRGPMLPRPPPSAPHQGRPQLQHGRPQMQQQGAMMGGGQPRGGSGSFQHLPRPPQQPPPSGGMVPMAPRPPVQQFPGQHLPVPPGAGLQQAPPPAHPQTFPHPGRPDQQQQQQQQQMAPMRPQFAPY